MSSEIARRVVLHFREQATQPDELEALSPCELEALEVLSNGFVNKEIAERDCRITPPAVVGVELPSGALFCVSQFVTVGH